MKPKHLNAVDRLLVTLDAGLRTLFAAATHSDRPNPAAKIKEADLTETQRDLAGRLMRVNHAGEVAAQGLYQGQALTARLPDVQDKMEQAAEEENDHLAWCQQRVQELGTHTSYLDPLWFAGSVAIGAAAGLAGDKWSLGFVVETERQVVEHLEDHMRRVPESDEKSRAILSQMIIDEEQHATTALRAGGAALPGPIKGLMKLTSKVMTRGAYWL